MSSQIPRRIRIVGDLSDWMQCHIFDFDSGEGIKDVVRLDFAIEINEPTRGTMKLRKRTAGRADTYEHVPIIVMKIQKFADGGIVGHASAAPTWIREDRGDISKDLVGGSDVVAPEPREQPCDDCGGTGTYRGLWKVEDCETCGGAGEVIR